MSKSGFASMAMALIGGSVPLFAQGSYPDLVKLDSEFLEFRKPRIVDGVADRGPGAMSAQRDGIEEIRKRLRAIDAASWPVPQRVDYLLVWAKLNALTFDHRVMKPWARDPILYLDDVSEIPYAETPLSAEKKAEVAAKLANVPKVMAQAQSNLTEANGELAKLAIFYLENFDGVGQGEPYRDQPPAGTIGWYQDLCGRLRQHHADLVPACQASGTPRSPATGTGPANVSRMPQSAAIGMANFNWYLTRAALFPMTRGPDPAGSASSIAIG
jgi:hypothetical protein